MFWEMAEFLANTLIFVFSGTIIATVGRGGGGEAGVESPTGRGLQDSVCTWDLLSWNFRRIELEVCEY